MRWVGEQMILLGVRISAVIGRLGDGEIVVTGKQGRHVEALLVHVLVIVKGIEHLLVAMVRPPLGRGSDTDQQETKNLLQNCI